MNGMSPASAFGTRCLVIGIAFVIAAGVLALFVHLGEGFAGVHVAKMFEQLVRDAGWDPAVVASAANMPETKGPVEVGFDYLTLQGSAFRYMRRAAFAACGLLGVSGVLLGVAGSKLRQSDKH